MEWSRPTQHGEIPTPRAGHAGVTAGENWFIVGGGDNKSGKCLTLKSNRRLLLFFGPRLFQYMLSFSVIILSAFDMKIRKSLVGSVGCVKKFTFITTP